MSHAHKNSRLVSIGRLQSIDNSTSALFHYDVTPNDVLAGIAPLQNISDLLPLAGRFGGGISIGENGVISYPIDIINPKEGTISFWLKRTTSPEDISIVYRNILSTDSSNGMFIRMSIVMGELTFYYGQRTCVARDSATISTIKKIGEWNCYAMSWDKDYIRAYLNGEKVAEGTGGIQLTTLDATSFFLGSFIGDSSIGIPGIYDELRIDKIARTDEEIMLWHASGAPFAPRGIYRIAY